MRSSTCPRRRLALDRLAYGRQRPRSSGGGPPRARRLFACFVPAASSRGPSPELRRALQAAQRSPRSRFARRLRTRRNHHRLSTPSFGYERASATSSCESFRARCSKANPKVGRAPAQAIGPPELRALPQGSVSTQLPPRSNRHAGHRFITGFVDAASLKGVTRTGYTAIIDQRRSTGQFV